MTKGIGELRWMVAGGRIPLKSNGKEPEFTSRDAIRVLNASSSRAKLEVMVHHEDAEPVGPYHIEVAAQRMREVRINDLIDPVAVLLDVAYGLTIQSDVPVVIQFTRQDTSEAVNAHTGTMAFPLD